MPKWHHPALSDSAAALAALSVQVAKRLPGDGQYNTLRHKLWHWRLLLKR